MTTLGAILLAPRRRCKGLSLPSIPTWQPMLSMSEHFFPAGDALEFYSNLQHKVTLVRYGSRALCLDLDRRWWLLSAFVWGLCLTWTLHPWQNSQQWWLGTQPEIMIEEGERYWTLNWAPLCPELHARGKWDCAFLSLMPHFIFQESVRILALNLMLTLKKKIWRKDFHIPRKSSP